MSLYRKDKLMEVVKDRGYVTQRAVADALVPIFGQSRVAIERKLRSGNLSKEECEVIGSLFQMTMKEYYDVFMHGLFQEDADGHYRCYIADMRRHVHPNPHFVPKVNVRKQKAAEIVDEIQRIEYDGHK